MSVPILSVAGMRAWEQATWAAGVAPDAVIRRVGERVAARLRGLCRPGDRVLVLAGRGNNGADAHAAAAHLPVESTEVLPLVEPAAGWPDLQAALARRPQWILDGLFGIGLNRPLDPGWQRCLRAINGSGVRIVALDVPSGLDADTGHDWGVVLRASRTLTIGAPKRGLLAPSAWEMVGALEVLRDVGLTGEPSGSDDRDWVLPEDFRDWPPDRPVSANKGLFGRVVVLAGSVGYSGAAVLALWGASRARPGLLSALVPEAVHGAISAAVPVAMVHPFMPRHPILVEATAVLVGPGLAAKPPAVDVHAEVLRLWREFPGVVVADASALDWLSDAGPEVPGAGPRVITPHPGEMARLLGTSAATVQADRTAALRAFAGRGPVWVVLKGHQTLMGGAQGRLLVNSTGNPGLAQGGSGDVLAGFLTGLLAQPRLQSDLRRTLALGVWEHGRTADLLEARSRNWTAAELADALGGDAEPGASAP